MSIEFEPDEMLDENVEPAKPLLGVLDAQLQAIDYIAAWQEKGMDFYDSWNEDLIQAATDCFKTIRLVQRKIRKELNDKVGNE